jgi:hypothetical protein
MKAASAPHAIARRSELFPRNAAHGEITRNNTAVAALKPASALSFRVLKTSFGFRAADAIRKA